MLLTVRPLPLHRIKATILFDGLSNYTLASTDDAMMARVLPKDPELKVEAEAHHTWHITDWRRLKKKEHGPVFECGGAPWFVNLFSLFFFLCFEYSSLLAGDLLTFDLG